MPIPTELRRPKAEGAPVGGPTIFEAQGASAPPAGSELPVEWLERSRAYVAQTIVCDLGTDGDRVRFVRSGWLTRVRPLAGGGRQVLELLLPGDHLPICAAHDGDHLFSLSPSSVVSVSPALVQDRRSCTPQFDAWLDAMEARRLAILNERLVSLGRRTSLERMAHLLCEMGLRLGAAATHHGFALPMTQADLADVLGISVVHANRTIQTLRRQGLVEITRGWVTIPNAAALRHAASFSPRYLTPYSATAPSACIEPEETNDNAVA